jgi:hypothetical protein
LSGDPLGFQAERGHPNISAIGASPREWQQ